FVINMPGFKEMLSHIETINIEGKELNVCPLEGIIILKLLAYNDRPHRTKDIDDVMHIVNMYFNMYRDDIYEEYHDVINLYEAIDGEDFERIISSRIIGRKIAEFLSVNTNLLNRIKSLLIT